MFSNPCWKKTRKSLSKTKCSPRHNEEKSSEKYLGDLITNSGKIDENIQNRVNKGNGSVNSIISLLEEISFGDHYFEMAILFRNSMLINSLLFSSEVLYGVKLRHIQLL